MGQYETALTLIDVVSKSVYAVTLMTGNFCIMDVVQTLRMQQMKAENDIKSAAVLRADVMNQVSSKLVGSKLVSSKLVSSKLVSLCYGM